jgi:hypothetical protein
LGSPAASNSTITARSCVTSESASASVQPWATPTHPPDSPATLDEEYIELTDFAYVEMDQMDEAEETEEEHDPFVPPSPSVPFSPSGTYQGAFSPSWHSQGTSEGVRHHL